MTTFGDLLAVADKYHATLISALYRPSIKEHAAHPGVVAELARFLDVLSRYNNKIADGFGVSELPSDLVRHAARRSAHLITEARTALGTQPAHDPYGPRLALTLRATSQTLGCGLDLLSSHVPHAQKSSQHLPGEAAIIAATDTARALLHTLTGYTATAGHLAFASGPQGRQAGAILLRTAIVEGFYGDSTPTPLNAIPLRITHGRQPPTPGENLDEALQGLVTSAERLRTAEITSSIATWRYLSMAATISCELTELLSRQLGRRLRELDHDDAGDSLIKPVPTELRKLRAKWRRIATSWKDLSQPQGTPNSDLAVDASDLIIRLGRLIYADPVWKPGPHSTHRVRPTSQLAPTIDETAKIGLAALRSLEAWSTLARHHRPTSHHPAVPLGIPTSPDPAMLTPNDSPQRIRISPKRRRARQVRNILDLYKNAHLQGTVIIEQLGNVLLALSSPGSPTATETKLVVRRSAAVTSNTASSAAADFPIPLAVALKPPSPSTTRGPAQLATSVTTTQQTLGRSTSR